MKKLILISSVCCLILNSCGSTQQSVRQVDINDTHLITEPKLVRYEVDLDTKLQGTIKMSKKYGIAYIKSAAVAEALKANPKADLIVDPQYQIKSKLLKMEVSVTGFLGEYTSVETLTKDNMKLYVDYNKSNGASGTTSSAVKVRRLRRK
jgi:hypothetical protein